MLIYRSSWVGSGAGTGLAVAQRGVVLMVSLIILVALTLGGIALLRSIDTTNIISGNLAFQQAATRSGEAGTEAAIQNVLEGVVSSLLENDIVTKGYSASVSNPSDWNQYWSTTINPSEQVAAGNCSTAATGGHVCVLPTDATGNTVGYTIQRLCETAGNPTLASTGCSVVRQEATTIGANLCTNCELSNRQTQYLYRVTTRVVGPRNTVSFIQTIVAK